MSRTRLFPHERKNFTRTDCLLPAPCEISSELSHLLLRWFSFSLLLACQCRNSQYGCWRCRDGNSALEGQTVRKLNWYRTWFSIGALGGFLTGNVARVITGRLCSYLCVLFSLVKSRKRTKKQPDEQKWNEKPSQMGFSLDSGRKEVFTIYWPTLWETWSEVWLLKKKNQCGPLGLIVINHCEYYW